MKIKKRLSYFFKAELLLRASSVLAVLLPFCLFDRQNILTPAASLIGVTSLIFCAKGSPYYAVAYAANDLVLIVLWIPAALEDISCLSVVVCFAAFLANGLYGFLNRRRMEKRQAAPHPVLQK